MSDNLIDIPADLQPNNGFAVEVVGALFGQSPTLAHGVMNVVEIALELNNALRSAGGSAATTGEFWGLVMSIVSSNTQDEADFRANFDDKWNLGR